MRCLRIVIFVSLLPFLAKEGNAQTLASLEEIAKVHQDCLDTGINMLGCSRQYYLEVDEMLNTVYNQLRVNMSAVEKEHLKKEQLSWLKRRDAYFKKQSQIFQRNFESGDWGSDMAMITYAVQAEFVKERVLVLMSRLNKQ